MIPMILRIKVKDGKKGVNLWIPLFLIWILLLPLVAIVFITWLLLHALSHLHYKVALGAAGLSLAIRSLFNLKDLRIEVKSGNDDILVYFI